MGNTTCHHAISFSHSLPSPPHSIPSTASIRSMPFPNVYPNDDTIVFNDATRYVTFNYSNQVCSLEIRPFWNKDGINDENQGYVM
jgi:hypothetical protein